jgi:(E)-4-hydroxy-3-methylbut-2-enyl-diphosphate synthase
MYRRLITREVMVGNVGIGGQNPIRIQSMTNTNTMDTAATVAQAKRLFDAGCELVRITAPGVKEAENLAVIKAELQKRGYNFPLIADVHYSPKAAEIAAQHVEKVRINPGNYTDRNRGKINFTEEEYKLALDKIRENLAPLIQICKTHNTALRIGSNHGSLSDRIVDRYGDTPAGMAEAAIEFAVICREMDFHNIVFSMKASNVRVMVLATRILVKRMMELGMDYPLHIGVTEAGDGMEGRVKSAAGMGALLANGIGDTIRVSLTEDPENEIPVAKQIISYFSDLKPAFTKDVFNHFFYPPFEFNLRRSDHQLLQSDQKPPYVIGNRWDYQTTKPDFIFNENDKTGWQETILGNPIVENFHPDQPVLAVANSEAAVFQFKELFRTFSSVSPTLPVILKKHYKTAGENLAIEAALDFGPLFLDGFGDGIWPVSESETPEKLVELAYAILQAAGARITKTEYIACPSCGRTQYNIQEALQKVKAATAHLTGLKIAVMGCIVNGPGEMADADYGYVGMGAGKVALYKGRQQVLKAVDESRAVATLIDLIKENGDWREKE